MRRGAVAVVLVILSVHFVDAQIRIIPQERLLDAASPKVAESSLRIIDDKVNFGTIDEMSGVWQGSATLINGGAETVAITRLKSTCGCLKAEVQRMVLAPGERTTMILKYYPRGHAGRVMQRVLVYTNASTNDPSAILQLQGVVTASADRSDDYPYERGALRLRQEELKFDYSGRQSLRIAVMNGGTTTLRPSVDAHFLPKGVKVRFEPTTLAPKQEGDMVVEYEPQSGTNTAGGYVLYLKGLNIPPRQSTIKITIREN